MTNIADLDKAIRAVCPIHGVSSSGRIDFRDEATGPQRDSAIAVLAAWDFGAPAQGEARATLDLSEAATVKADNQVQTFLNFTQAELDAWIDANITGTGNKTAFKVLGRLAQAAARGRTLR